MTDVTQYDSIIKTALRQKRVRKDQYEDMSQECYVALLEKQGELDPETVGKICRTRIKSLIREQEQGRVKKEKKIRFVSADLPSVSRLLHKIIEDQEGPVSESEFYQAIDRLDENYREVLRKVYIEGLTQKSAAEKLKIPLRTLQRRINRGIMELRQILTA